MVVLPLHFALRWKFIRTQRLCNQNLESLKSDKTECCKSVVVYQRQRRNVGAALHKTLLGGR